MYTHSRRCPIRATPWTHKATYSRRGKGQADWSGNDLAQWYVAAVTGACGCLLSMLNYISHLVRLETQSVHPLTCCVRCNYLLQFFCCVTGNWCVFPQEGLKSVLIVNLSRPGLTPGSLLPPPGINTNFPQQPPSPIFTILRTEGPVLIYSPIHNAFIASCCATKLCFGPLPPCPWNLITASLTNLTLIHFWWRWLITVHGKVI